MADDSSGASATNSATIAFIALAQSLIWPALVIYSLYIFGPSLKNLLDRSDSLKVQIPGGLTLEAVASSAAQASAAAQKQGISPQQATANISQIFSANEGRPITMGRILWVDDNPTNNILLINAFQDLGVRVFLASSTDQAEALMSQSTYDVVISDMSRPPDEDAGKNLIDWMKSRKLAVPVIIYAARWAAEHQGEESKIGALRITNDPSTVYHIALRAIQRL